MISGAHLVVYSRNADADRAFLRDILDLKFIDAGHGWLIFALPPAEVAVHPADETGTHELFFQSDNLKADMESLAQKGVSFSQVHEARWGSITRISLPGGSSVGLYQPKHAVALGLK